MSAVADASRLWRMIVESITRPYRVTIPMVVFMSLIPVYIVIAGRVSIGALHRPALDWDHALPLAPAWGLVYGALYMFLIVLPVFVVRQEGLLRRTVYAYLTVWIVAYLAFVLYPTEAPRPVRIEGNGFAEWGLRILYDADPPYNCFPSLHVAHSFVSALACYRVHRRLGAVALGCGALVGLSTLFTKQHYVADVIAGMIMALVAYSIFLRPHRRDQIPESDRRLAPAFGVGVAGIAVVGVAGFWIAYLLQR